MIAAIPPVITDIAALCGAALVVITFAAALSRLRPVRWVWRRLISDPLSQWFANSVGAGVADFHAVNIQPVLDDVRADVREVRGEVRSMQADIAGIHNEMTTNGGSTLRDVVEVARAEAGEAKVAAQQALSVAQAIASDRGLPPGFDPTERAQ